MKLLTLADFKATRWQVQDKAIGAIVNGMIATQEIVFAKYGITQDLEIVHFMAQISEECGRGTEMTESLDYTPAKLLKQWKTHFTSLQAQNYGRTKDHPANQKMIGELAYGGRMGNAPAPAEDGYNFRGRGLIQTTGRDGYATLGKRVGLDLIKSPDLVSDSTHALECAVAEFVHYPNMLKYCLDDNLLAVSALINVGYLVSDPGQINGYDERAAELKRWKQRYGI